MALVSVGELTEQGHRVGVFRTHLGAPGQPVDDGQPGLVLLVHGPVLKRRPQRPGGVAVRVHRAVRVRRRDQRRAREPEVPGREEVHGDQGRRRTVGGQCAGEFPVQATPP